MANHYDDNDFALYRKLIIAQLERLEQAHTQIQNEIQKLKTSTAIQKAQTTLIASFISISIAIISILFNN